MKHLGRFALAVLVLAVHARAQDFARWRHAKPLTLNTSASGADVKGDVRNFPLAVALDASNFDFTQAKPNGADVRLSANADGETLPHAIEHWDAEANTALIWVKVPLVRGDDAKQSIHMHWGNPDAPAASDSPAVFDTRDGFVGVWHLNESGR